MLLRSNNERAFVIAQLQDLLSPRLVVGDIPAYRQLASCIDLLAFSISRETVHLLLFSIDSVITADFAHRIAARVSQYQYNHRPNRYASSLDIHISTESLAGPHEALAQSIKLHMAHQDWEYDRYSSIGFYLHDRRGDWMRIWRLTQLYDNNELHYRELIDSYFAKEAKAFPTLTPQFLASSPHG